MSWRGAAGGEGTEDVVVDAQTDEAGDGTGAAAAQLHPGQRVQAQVDGVVHWAGTVETVSVSLNMVWIHESGLGERKLLDLREYQLHPQAIADG